jgi:hypothetical protein
MDKFQMVALVLYLLSVVIVVIGVIRAKDHDTGPVWCFWLAAIIAGITATYAQNLGGPIGLLSGAVLHIAMPILLIVAGVFGFIYAWEAITAGYGMNVFGWSGTTTQPQNNAQWKQWDVALILAIASAVSIFVGLHFGWNSFKGFWDSLPGPAGRPAVEKTLEIVHRLETVPDRKPLKSSSGPFAMTLYPEEFKATAFNRDMKSVFDPKIAHLGVEVDEFVQIRIEEVPAGVDIIGHFTTKPIPPAIAVPAGTELLTLRVPVQTPEGVDAWVAENVQPRVQALYDRAEALGKIDPAAKPGTKRTPRVGVSVPTPTDPGLIGGS